MLVFKQHHWQHKDNSSFAASQESAALTFCHWSEMTIWLHLSNSPTKKVPNPEKRLLLIHKVMFSIIKSSVLYKQIFVNNSAVSVETKVTFRILDPYPTSATTAAKIICFLITLHFPVDVIYLQTKLLAVLMPSDISLQPCYDTPQREATYLFQICSSFLSTPEPSYS